MAKLPNSRKSVDENILKLICEYEDDKYLYLVTEMMDTSLDKIIYDLNNELKWIEIRDE